MFTVGGVVRLATVAVAVYAVVLGALLTPSLQRFAVYAHKINTLFLNDIHDAQEFGFAKGQVTPFTIPTVDGETLYAWHVLPLDAYVHNEKALREQAIPDGPVEDFTTTLPFSLLTRKQPDARILVNFHGNAGHVAQGWRTDTYRLLASQSNTHVFTIDYRGFGHSTGSPTEAGLIADGTALVNWIMHTAKVHPEQIVILGQSLGTAVASAVALNFADPSNDLIPRVLQNAAVSPELSRDTAVPTAFAGVILVAPFSSLPSLMLTYRIGGILPILLPLRPFPWLADALTSRMTDTWPTADRLKAWHAAMVANPKLLESKVDDLSGDGSHTSREMGTLQVIHATNDMDISYHQTELICQRIIGDAARCIEGSNGAAEIDFKEKGSPRMRFQILEHGGHNRVVTHSPIAVAVMKALDGKFS